MCALAAFSYLLTYGNGVFDVRGKVADADARFCAKREEGREEASRAESRMRERTGCLFKGPRYIFRFTLSLLLFLNSLSFLVRCPKNQQCEARSEEVFLGEKGRCWPLPHFRDSEVNIKNCHLACK